MSAPPGSVTDRPQGRASLARFYSLIAGDEDARVCRDIPEEACRDVPRNFLVHLAAQTATKIGDELASAKLVLAWLLSSAGAPGVMIGLLVPIRESLALVPQLAVASLIRKAPIRKWFWVGGSILQGLAVVAIAGVAARLSGAAAGAAVLGLLVVFSLARGVCSVSSKDVLGKTVSKARRGRLMGYAASVAGIVTIAVGVAARARRDGPEAGAFFTALLLTAGALWILGAIVFSGLRETPGATAGGGNAFGHAVRSLGLLGTDPRFRHFVITRALLLGTALAQPFYVILARERGTGGLAGLGLLIIASGLAASVSAPVWGRMADRSSRRVLIAASLLAGGLGLLVFAADVAGLQGAAAERVYALAFLVLAVAHSGVRLGRKTYLIDMATAETRASYVAVSNTAIGILLMLGGGLGLVADARGPAWAVLLFSLITLVGALSAKRLPEVE